MNLRINQFFDPIIIHSIRYSIGQLLILDLQDFMRIEGLKIVDSKELLQERLNQAIAEVEANTLTRRELIGH